MDHYSFPKGGGGIVIGKNLSAWDHLCVMQDLGNLKKLSAQQEWRKKLASANRWWKKISCLLEITIPPRENNGLSLSGWDLSIWKISKQMLSFFSKMSRTILSVSSFSCSLTPSYYETVSLRILLSLIHFQLVLHFELTDLLKQYWFFFLPAVKFIRIRLVCFFKII